MDIRNIVVDAMGGDRGPSEIIKGACLAAQKLGSNVQITVMGDEETRKANTALYTWIGVPSNLGFNLAPEVIEPGDSPLRALSRKPNSSLVQGTRWLQTGLADAMVTFGNSAAAVIIAVRTLGYLPGIQHAALASRFSTLKGDTTTVILDIGANINCGAPDYLHLAMMGQQYALQFPGCPAFPRVGILSIGEERCKGTPTIKEAHQFLRRLPGFVGNVESKEVLAGQVAVVVTDGFTGNIFLKTAEATALLLTRAVKQEVKRYWWAFLPALPLFPLALPAFFLVKRSLFKRFDYREFGGAPLLGVNKVFIIGHGRSDAKAVAMAIQVAYESVERDLVRHIAGSLKRLEAIESSNK